MLRRPHLVAWRESRGRWPLGLSVGTGASTKPDLPGLQTPLDPSTGVFQVVPDNGKLVNFAKSNAGDEH